MGPHRPADRIAAFFQEKTPRRALALAALAGLVFAFKGLFVLFVFFIAFHRSFGAAASFVSARAKVPRTAALVALVVLFLAALGVAGWFAAHRIASAAQNAQAHLPERIEEIKRSPLYEQFKDKIPGTEKIVEHASHYAAEIFHGVATVGHVLLELLIAFILALLYELQIATLTAWRASLGESSLLGTLVRWIGYMADAISVTLQLQVIVAACNAAVTLPILFWLGVPHKFGLMLLVFASSLVPVIGNVVSGAVLSFVAYQAKGLVGVAIFVALTFVLHKLEAYYLNPRLTARHVKLPGFLLVLSLLAWEHLLGFAGLFVSFPFLYVAGKIRADLREEDGKDAPDGPAPELEDAPPEGKPEA